MTPINPERLRPYVVVDVSNVARYGTKREEKGRLQNVKTVLNQLWKAGVPFFPWADASLRWHIDDPEALEEMFQSLEMGQSDKGTEADRSILKLAKRELRRGRPVYLLSNDQFREYPEAKGIPRIDFDFHRDGSVSFRPGLDALLNLGDYAKAFPGILSPKESTCPHASYAVTKKGESVVCVCRQCGAEFDP